MEIEILHYLCKMLEAHKLSGFYFKSKLFSSSSFLDSLISGMSAFEVPNDGNIDAITL